jgi:hypothetical protein
MVETIITFPETPMANELLDFNKKKNGIEQTFFPLNLGICGNCGHIQLTYLIEPSLLFKNYPYLSNSNDQTSTRFLSLANEFSSIYNNVVPKFAFEIGSNDGHLLSILKLNGWDVLGIDPSEKASVIATSIGVENICDFFSSKISGEILKKYKYPNLIIANNVLAHTNEMHDIFLGIYSLMNLDTLFVMEFSYALDIYENLLFDTIYHEHMSYHSIHPLTIFLNKFDLVIVDVIRFGSHGGSARVYIRKNQNNLLICNRVSEILDLEHRIELSNKESWKKFESRISSLKITLTEALLKINSEGKSIVGYGVPAKFTTLFYTLELKESFFEYIVDDNPLKQGHFAPGTNLKIFPVEKLVSDKIDYIFIFSWNYSDEIHLKIMNNKLCNLGVIIPLPEFTIKHLNYEL